MQEQLRVTMGSFSEMLMKTDQKSSEFHVEKKKNKSAQDFASEMLVGYRDGFIKHVQTSISDVRGEA